MAKGFSSRPRHVGGGSGSIGRRGGGLGTGPVGSSGIGAGHSAPSGSSFGKITGGGGSGGGGGWRPPIRGGGNGCGCSSLVVIAVVIILIAAIGGCSIFGNLFNSTAIPQGVLDDLSPSSSSTWSSGVTGATLNTSVAEGSREKFTKITGNDVATVMVYLCGSDLESKGGYATKDLIEMTKATLSDKLNVLVMTGGSKSWNNDIVDAKKNQVYRVADGGVNRLSDNLADGAMTKPETLLAFLKYCKTNFPANRYELIFWDHGTGSVQGYGFDDRYSETDTLTLPEINKALTQSGMKFDFIGFDACLMGGVENALMLANHADYMIASEETEPGIGWYYTDWLTEFSKNTSMPTLELGKKIIDDFTAQCGIYCRGQSSTLSLTDLAETENTVKSSLKTFSNSITHLVEAKDYEIVSKARSNSKEFSKSTILDEIDLAHFAENLGSSEGKALAEAVKGAVKYNLTSGNTVNAYGLSVYFPYRNPSSVDTAVKTYEDMGMDESLTKCIKAFAGTQAGGLAATFGLSDPFSILSGSGNESPDTSVSGITDILSGLFGGGTSSVPSLSSGSFFRGRDAAKDAEYISQNMFNPTGLTWTQEGDDFYITLPSEQWELINDINMNMYIDDGEGFINLGLDKIFSFENNRLYAETYGDWLSIDGKIVPFYYDGAAEDTVGGYVPAMLNEDRVEILISIDGKGYGHITGYRPVYEEENAPVSKIYTDIPEGAEIEPICDYYTYKGEYIDSYKTDKPFTLSADPVIENIKVEGKVYITYMFTDIYGQNYWSAPIML